MAFSYDPEAKTLTIEYVDNPQLYPNESFSGKEIYKVIVKGSFTVFKSNCFTHYRPLYEITIPESITTMGNNIISGCSLKSFPIPKDFQYFSSDQPFDWIKTLEEFTIDDRNQYFAVVDGILFSKDMKILYCYPNNKKGDIYQVPHGVTTIFTDAFSQTIQLKKVIIPASVKSINCLFYGASHSTKTAIIYRCPCENPSSTLSYTQGSYCFPLDSIQWKTSGYNETLFDHGKVLVVAPMNECNASYYGIDFDDTTFAGNEELETVIFETGINKITSSSFSNCKNLKRVSFPATLASIAKDAFKGSKMNSVYRSIFYAQATLNVLTKHFSKYSLGLTLLTNHFCRRGNNLILFIVTLVYK